jgi:hypothetical protein
VNLSKAQREFFALLDESPRDTRSLIVRDRGETRSFPIKSAAKAYELRTRGGKGPRFPRLARAQSLTAILGHILEREERDAES